LDRDEFIETQVAFQLGACSAASGLDVESWARAQAERRGSFLYHDPGRQVFVPEDRGSEIRRARGHKWVSLIKRTDAKIGIRNRAGRNATFLSELYACGLDVPVLVDMQDAVRSPNTDFPVFQYVRMTGARNAVLWPLRRVHAIGSPMFCSAPDPEEPALAEKRPKLYWRGSLRGFSTHGSKPSNIKYIIKMHLAGRFDRKTLLANLATIPRWQLVSRYFGVDGFDVGFPRQSLGEYLQVPEIARYAVDYAPHAEQLQHKYLISLQGTDVGTSFGWQLGSNSVLLRETYPWEVFFDCHIRPFEHFVPVATDLSDLPDKIAWCERNPDACAAMVEKRHAVVTLLLDSKVRSETSRRLIWRYGDFYRQWAAN
jgi:hypothetical protein